MTCWLERNPVRRLGQVVRGVVVASLLLWAHVPSARAASASSLVAQALTHAVPQRFDRADFMENDPRDIAMENRANPLQAWALAFFPTLLVKGATITVAYLRSSTDAWAPYLVLIPSMGLSHFWETKIWWAGLIALGGDLIGSGILTYYFNQVNAAQGGVAPSQTSLWGGIAVLAVFFLYENISAPVLAMWRNKKLMRQFAPASKKEGEHALRLPDTQWRRSPWPARPLAGIGPMVRAPAAPIGAGWTFQF